MLLGVLLIKTLPSKCISQIRLDKKIYIYIYRGRPVEEDEERRRFSTDDKRKERLTFER